MERKGEFSLRDLLDRDDKANSGFIPGLYKLTQSEKQKALEWQRLLNLHQMGTIGGCLKKCLSHLDTPMVSDNEANCTYNCVSKGQEVLVDQLSFYQDNIYTHTFGANYTKKKYDITKDF